jgi:hypothetical protein
MINTYNRQCDARGVRRRDHEENSNYCDAQPAVAKAIAALNGHSVVTLNEWLVDLNVFGLRSHSFRTTTVNPMYLHRRLNGPVIVGHRGAGRGSATSGLLTVHENTLESFLLANQCGVQWIETDTERTADDQHITLLMITGL